MYNFYATLGLYYSARSYFRVNFLLKMLYDNSRYDFDSFKNLFWRGLGPNSA